VVTNREELRSAPLAAGAQVWAAAEEDAVVAEAVVGVEEEVAVVVAGVGAAEAADDARPWLKSK
jgi:hypothetical protein